MSVVRRGSAFESRLAAGDADRHPPGRHGRSSISPPKIASALAAAEQGPDQPDRSAGPAWSGLPQPLNLPRCDPVRPALVRVFRLQEASTSGEDLVCRRRRRHFSSFLKRSEHPACTVCLKLWRVSSALKLTKLVLRLGVHGTFSRHRARSGPRPRSRAGEVAARNCRRSLSSSRAAGLSYFLLVHQGR